MSKLRRVLVTGGAGYVGSRLIPKLLDAGHDVTVIDLYLYGNDIFPGYDKHPHLTQIQGDIRDEAAMRRAMKGQDAVIHLACISNDPSYELNPNLGKSINYDAFLMMVPLAKEAKVKRFIYASSSSVYGIKDEPEVTEELLMEPLTDYSKYKALCETELLKHKSKDFCVLILRPATVCGYAPRLRLDLTVNILTNLAVNKGKITVFGGQQKRPNIHIEDMTDLYVKCLEFDDARINGKIFNAGYENHSVSEIAGMVKRVIGDSVTIETTETNDNRSYHISSKKILTELGFAPRYTIEDAIIGLKDAFVTGKIPNPEDKKYFNVKLMQHIGLK